MTALLVIGSLLVALALFSTTGAGRRLWVRLGLPPLQGRAPRKDRDFLLQATGGDPEAVRTRIDAERARHPAATDAELHRRAIRTWFQQQDR